MASQYREIGYGYLIDKLKLKVSGYQLQACTELFAIEMPQSAWNTTLR